MTRFKQKEPSLFERRKKQVNIILDASFHDPWDIQVVEARGFAKGAASKTRELLKAYLLNLFKNRQKVDCSEIATIFGVEESYIQGLMPMLH